MQSNERFFSALRGCLPEELLQLRSGTRIRDDALPSGVTVFRSRGLAGAMLNEKNEIEHGALFVRWERGAFLCDTCGEINGLRHGMILFYNAVRVERIQGTGNISLAIPLARIRRDTCRPL